MKQSVRAAQHLDELRKAVLELVQAMDDEALNHRPDGLANSPGILVRHLLGSERYWIHGVVGEEDVQRDRDAEFDPSIPVRKEELLSQVESVANRTREILERMSESELDQPVEAVAGGSTVRLQKGDAVLRTLIHWAYHQGQLHLMRRLGGRG